MAWVAGKACRINGVDYQPGEAVPTEGLRNLRALIGSRFLIAAPDAPASSGEAGDDAPDLTDLTRAELNALAVERGIEAPDKLPNKAAVIAALHAVPADDGEPGGEGSSADESAGTEHDPSTPPADEETANA